MGITQTTKSLLRPAIICVTLATTWEIRKGTTVEWDTDDPIAQATNMGNEYDL